MGDHAATCIHSSPLELCFEIISIRVLDIEIVLMILRLSTFDSEYVTTTLCTRVKVITMLCIEVRSTV